ncbi:MAG: DHHA1 domain-containing protein [Bacteroidales bacterium]|nr:DHHA1 domain-containing protein [Bacteroidales bacterium]
MKCFYHNDLDGQASAFCVFAWVGNRSNKQGEFIPINYDMAFPFDSIEKDEQVWIVDYSISPDEMRKLLKITQDVVWIDHHKTAIEKYSNFESPIRGIRKDGEAGCVLTWKYIHWWTARGEGKENFSKENPDIPVEKFIDLVGDRDIWAWKYGDETKNFFNGSGLYNTDPDGDFWWDCMTKPDFMKRVQEEGKTIQRYKDMSDIGLNKRLGYAVEFEGYNCFAINRTCSSDRLQENMDKYDIGIPYIHKHNGYTVSLYSKKDIDVSEIAKKYGGGGHKKASGFQCDELPWFKSGSIISLKEKK